MGIEYGPAIDMLITDPAWVFTDALKSLSGDQLSIVLHKTACNGPCTAQSTASFFASDTTNHKSVHFVIGLDGAVVQCVHLKDGAGGNCCLEAGHDSYWDAFAATHTNLNTCTISIEHVDQTIDNSQPMTPEQIAASFALVAWLVQKFSIPLSHLKTHASLDPISKAHCPGPTYPLADLLAHIEGGNVATLNSKGEIADFVDVSQFESNESEFACGYFAAGECKFAGAPGKGPTGTPEQLDQWADSQGGATTGGVSIEDMHTLFHAAGLHYWDTDIAPTTQQSHDLATIKAALQHGYAVVATVAETSVYDMDLGGNPYAPNWTPSGNHVFTYTGIASDGNLLVHDTAAVQGGIFGKIAPQPRRYRASSIENHWASIVQLPWLPPIPSGDPLSWQAPAPDFKRKAFEAEWQSVVKDAMLTSGIASQAWADYEAGNGHGPALSEEFDVPDWMTGALNRGQIVLNGIYIWAKDSDGKYRAHYHPYK